MYMPRLAREAVEHRLGSAEFAAAPRERAFAGARWRVLARLGRWLVDAWAAVHGGGRVFGRSALQVRE
jgi:DNA-binding helix-hairpin-helix protein with protein kinase domain